MSRSEQVTTEVAVSQPPQIRQEPFARACYAVVAVLGLIALGLSIRNGIIGPSTVPDGAGYSHVFPAGWPNVLNQFMYFTFMSNLLVVIAAAWLAIKPRTNSELLRVLNICALVCIMVTGIVFNFLLRNDDPMSPLKRFHDTIQHIFTPIVFPLLWLIFGPIGRVVWRRIAWSTVIPLAWLVTTLVRGELLDWYPYSILDVPKLGYGPVLAYVAGILVLYFVLATALWGIDRARSRRTEHLIRERSV